MKLKNLLSRFMLFISSLGLVLAHEGEDLAEHHGMMSGWGYGMGFFGWIFMTLIIIVLVLFIVWLIKQIQSADNGRRRR